MAEQEYGFLKVFVTTASSTIPLPGAMVTVSEEQNGQTVLLYTAQTDQSGQTTVFSLPAPPLAYSESPGNPTPIQMYLVDVTREGYVPVAKYQVPIYAQTQAVLPVVMTPVGIAGQPLIFVSPAGNTPDL